jgi:hypothetical protein
MEDPDFIEDIFAANEIGEELCKLTIEKEKEAKKQESLDKEAAKKGPQPPKKEGLEEATEKPVEPNQELLWQLKDMGFLEGLSKQALIKVKNESIAAAVEAVVALQSEQATQMEKNTATVADKKATVVQWNCEACTIINQPGGTHCMMCNFAAPAKAFVDEQAEKAAKEAEEK